MVVWEDAGIFTTETLESETQKYLKLYIPTIM